MGGELKLESEVGKGSRFYFTLTLPLGEAPKVQEPEIEYQHIKLRTGKQFVALCVDDVADNREVLGTTLKACGIEVLYAENGQEAIEKIKSHQFDIVFMDLLMPVMRGDDAIKVIRGELKNDKLVCIAISAFSLHHEIQHYLSIGFDQFIAKPFTFGKIHNSLMKFFPQYFVESEDNSEQLVHVEPTINFRELSLDVALLKQLKLSAAINRSSHVKTLLQQLVETRPAVEPYVTHLQDYIDNFDMPGLAAALEEINNGE